MVVNSGSCWQAISFGLSGPPEVNLNVSPADETEVELVVVGKMSFHFFLSYYLSLI